MESHEDRTYHICKRHINRNLSWEYVLESVSIIFLTKDKSKKHLKAIVTH